MLSLTRALGPRLAKPIALQVTSKRCESQKYSEDGEISIYRISPEFPKTKQYVGDYPKTKEAREQAAKKYNLLPEDYEPYPEDEGWGDYPKLKAVGEFNRDKYDDFDEPTDYRYYGEPLQRDFDMFKWERIDPLEGEKPNALPHMAIRFIVGVGVPAFLYLLFYLSEEYKIGFNPPNKMRRKYPDQPLYTFPSSPIDGTEPHLNHNHH